MQKNHNQSTPQEVPFQVGDEFTARVNALGEKGDGIVRVKGVVVIVPGVKKGDNIKFKIQKILPKVSFATFVSKVTPEEVAPQRPAFNKEAFKAKVPKGEDVSHLLTTDGDSEDFGGGDDEDDEDDL